VPSRIQQPSAFPTISVEKNGTLSRQPKPTVIEVENTTGSNAASHFLKWLRKRQPKPAPPVLRNDRANWTGSLPRNFSVRIPSNGPSRIPAQKAKVVKNSTKQVAPTSISLTRYSEGDGYYDNTQLRNNSGYCNVKLVSTTSLTPTQEAEASKYATISKRNLPRYDPLKSQKSNLNTFSYKMSSLPRTPTPDYSDKSSRSSSLSPLPNTRVRFNLESTKDDFPIRVELPKQSIPIEERREKVHRPRNLFARTFERKIYKKLKPLIQIRGIRVDEKDIVRSAPLQRSIRSNVNEKPGQLNSLDKRDCPILIRHTKRRAPPPPIEKDERILSSPLYDNFEVENAIKNICYVGGNRIEYRLEWSGNQLLVHYESRNLNDELRNTADAEIIAELLAESERASDLVSTQQRPIIIVPQRGTLTGKKMSW
jgi:hypothetical protein